MELKSSFMVPATPDEAFGWLRNLENVAPCMPGAKLLSQSGDTYQGELSLRVGPIAVSYAGEVRVLEADEQARRALLEASGREQRGQGTASARVEATVRDAPGGSQVDVVTDLDVRGKAAQFGRGVLSDVSQQIIDQFARNLASALQPAPSDSGARPSSAPPPSGPAPAESLDVLALVRGPLAERGVPLLVALVIGIAIGRLLRRRPSAASIPAWPPPPWWTPPPPGAP